MFFIASLSSFLMSVSSQETDTRTKGADFKHSRKGKKERFYCFLDRLAYKLHLCMQKNSSKYLIITYLYITSQTCVRLLRGDGHTFVHTIS